MNAKWEWRKAEKGLYLPKSKPEIIEVPPFRFLTIQGKGNPNGPEFSHQVGALYAVAYGIKMHLKRALPTPPGYRDFTVYPLEGIWDITDEAKRRFTGQIDKDDLLYTLMIRQPDFVDEALFTEIRDRAKQKRQDPWIEKVSFASLAEGRCVQMLHLGPFDEEPASFAQMESFAKENGLIRMSKRHREVYLSDPRRVSPDKYRTVLRFQVAAARQQSAS